MVACGHSLKECDYIAANRLFLTWLAKAATALRGSWGLPISFWWTQRAQPTTGSSCLPWLYAVYEQQKTIWSTRDHIHDAGPKDSHHLFFFSHGSDKIPDKRNLVKEGIVLYNWRVQSIMMGQSQQQKHGTAHHIKWQARSVERWNLVLSSLLPTFKVS